MEEARKRQDEELVVMQEIYQGCVTDLRKGGGFKWEPLSYSLRLEPKRESSHPSRDQVLVKPTIRLTVRLAPNYPEVAPQLSIDEVKGLTNQETSELVGELNSLATGHLGEVMVFDLCQRAEEYLHDHQKQATGSFYDDMLNAQKLQEEKKSQKEQSVKDKENLAMQEEIQKRQEAFRENERLEKEQRRVHTDSVSSLGDLSPDKQFSRSPSKESTFPQPEKSHHNKKRTHSRKRSGTFRRNSEESDSSFSDSTDLFKLEVTCQKETRVFQRGEVLGVSSTGRTMYAGMDSRNGSLVAISEWKFPVRSEKRSRSNKDNQEKRETADELIAKINGLNLDNDLRVLQKLSHMNIVELFGMQTMVPVESGGTVNLYMVEEFVRGNTLQSYLQESVTLELSFVRHCALGILQGLQYIHSKNVVHLFMRDTSIFVDSKGVIKMSDYGLERKLYDFFKSTNEKVEVGDKFAKSIGRGAKKLDIYRAGVIILSLLNGKPVAENPPQIPSSFPLELRDFLGKFFTSDEQTRWTAAQLLDHKFLKIPMEKMKIEALTERAKSENPPNDELLDELETQGFIPQNVVGGQSRLQREFQVIQWLGKGGFGDVVKVRNKLDSGIYALKRIRLNPRNKQLNRKITREVKLLSQLNHENIVRYYNSWIETVVEEEGDTTSTEPTATSPSMDISNKKSTRAVRFRETPPMVKRNNSLGLVDNVEDLAPPVHSHEPEWSTSYAAGRETEEDDDSDGSSGSDNEDLFGTSFLGLELDDRSDSIAFNDESSTSSPPSSPEKMGRGNGSATNLLSPEVGRSDDIRFSPSVLGREAKYMYIQMEFCEKSTLRTAIDSGLHEDSKRTWRLFREIVEGLAHIHQQGMIHRDLKPVNIFLDSNDNVKIGDFGLATSNILHRGPGAGGGGGDGPTVPSEKFDTSTRLEEVDFGDGESLTGQVGTALYVAPELIKTGTKAVYDLKVDIYSLGIIFFEMFYRPPETGMERVRIIHGLRLKEITLPRDFDENLYQKQIKVIKWLLNHDPSLRPTSAELLQSDHLPPLEMQEAKTQEVFHNTLSNPQSKAYKFLIQSCFKQTSSAAEDMTFDMRSSGKPETNWRQLMLRQRVKEIICAIFEKHGALEMGIPLLMPKTNVYQGIGTSVEVMTHGGSVVTIPHDLRIPFARYVGSNSLTNIKRFAVDKVFRERRLHGWHPKELYECAFDIISSSKASLLADAEVISSVFEITSELPWLRDKNFTIRLGHTSIIEAVLHYFGIDVKQHAEIKTILEKFKTDKNSKAQLENLKLPEAFSSFIESMVGIEGPLSKISTLLKGMQKRKGDVANFVKEALYELGALETHMEAFGLKSNVVAFSPGMIFATNIYSGLIFQVVCHSKKKNKAAMELIAAGGRYDALLENFRSSREATGLAQKGTKQFGVGVSLALDKLVPGNESEGADKLPGEFRSVDIVICSLENYAQSARDKIAAMKDFWANGISCTCLDGPEFQKLEAVDEKCKEFGAIYGVVLSESVGPLRVRYYDSDRIHEKKHTKGELIDIVLRRKSEANEAQGSSSSSALNLKCANEGNYKSESSSNIPASHPSNHQQPAVNITFILPENKEKNANWRKRMENIMIIHINDVLNKLSRQQTVQLLAIEANSSLVIPLGSYLHIHDKEQYNRSALEILEKNPRPKYVKAICDEIRDLVFQKMSPVIIIFGLSDNCFKVLM